MTDDDITKRAAVHLLSEGVATYAEIAGLCGRSRQAVRCWVPKALDSREKYLRAQWRAALQAARQKD